MSRGPSPRDEPPGGNRFRQTNRADRPSRFMLFVRRHKHILRFFGGVAVLVAGGTIFLRIHGVQTVLAPLRSKIVAEIPLRVTAIRVEGQNLTSPDSIRAALGVSVGDPMLEFDVAAARKRLDDLPFVDHASVERHLSGLIVVRLVERPPFAVWQHHGRFVLIDHDGNPVPDKGMTGKDARAFMQLPLVVGEGADHAAADLLDAVAKVPDVSSRMTAATLVGDRRWTITLKDGTIVYLPEAEEVPALNRLASLQKRFGLLDRPVEIIDLRLPDRMTIRERPGASDTDATSDQKQDAGSGAAGAVTGAPAGGAAAKNVGENAGAPHADAPVARPVGHAGSHNSDQGMSDGNASPERSRSGTPQEQDGGAEMKEGVMPA
ncbi:cell division protein FtsQ/DivIB [Acetobacter fallax]|uniref:Cell division protein FtsQ n=1 Tax=Acetobacter fallax TaxID=1737473 RepID=A0ABX0KCH3_9PROT|nr:cell division protein FtsQ/DivIB [Acetobacter fallax]NHO32205.1 FtsQ-type POTRA domain-containing protein [Acetobacter fallax]NHO35742.1 FtsQ-type POTRA domain-containing protein [Acetobacter fallax]